MSDDQIKQKVGAVIEEWWKYCRSPKLLNEQHNISEIFEATYNDAKNRGGNIDVADVTLVVNRLGDIDRGGKLIYHKTATQVAPVTTAADAPWLDEPRLRSLVSMSALAQLTAEQTRAFCSVTAMHEYDERGRKVVSLNQKFNERVAWLRNHRDANLTEAINRVLGNDGPQQPQVVVRKRQEDPRITAIREQIDKDFKGYTNWAIQKRNRLNTTLDEILRDPSRQIYRDRSRGGVEIIRGLAAIEHLMADAINDAVNGSVQ